MRSAENAGAIRRVVVTILWLNVAVAAAKGIYAWMSGSLSVASDAVHSVLDAAANVGGIIALRVASNPPDESHPYGHQKVEIVASAIVGLLIAAGSLRFAWAAVNGLLVGGTPPTVTVAGFATMGGTLAVNILVATYEARRGRQLGSAFLVADAAHTASDVAVTCAVLVALTATRLGVGWADSAGALLVLGVVAVVAWRILSSNLGILLDHSVVDAQEVRRIATAIDGVVGCHRVRSRGLVGAVLVDLHLQVDGELSLREAHALSHQVETAVRERFPDVVDVTIHVEPEEEPEEGL